jgi:hypothetical protein
MDNAETRTGHITNTNKTNTPDIKLRRLANITQIKTGVQSRCSRRLNNSCFLKDTRRITQSCPVNVMSVKEERKSICIKEKIHYHLRWIFCNDQPVGDKFNQGAT